MLEHGTGGHLTEALVLQAEAGDQAVDGGGEHVLVGRARVLAVGPGERDAVAADDGGATRTDTDDLVNPEYAIPWVA